LEVVDSLVGLHLLDSIWGERCVCPVQVPVDRVLLEEAEVKGAAGLLDHSPLALHGAQD